MSYYSFVVFFSPLWNRIVLLLLAFGWGISSPWENTLDPGEGAGKKRKAEICCLPTEGRWRGWFPGGLPGCESALGAPQSSCHGSELQRMLTQWEVWMCLPILLQTQWRFYFSLFLLKEVHSAIQPLENILKSILV